MVRVKPTWSNQANSRGQVVLLAAVVIVVALVPMVLAYLQLGYAGDVGTSVGTDPGGEAERVLDRAVHDSVDGIAQSYEWEQRTLAVRAVRDRLEPQLQTLEQSRLQDGIAYEIAYNDSRARRWADDNCKRGPDRQFGPCESIDGVVVQERGDGTHVLAAAFDVAVTTPQGELDLTTTIPVRVGDSRDETD